MTSKTSRPGQNGTGHRQPGQPDTDQEIDREIDQAIDREVSRFHEIVTRILVDVEPDLDAALTSLYNQAADDLMAHRVASTPATLVLLTLDVKGALSCATREVNIDDNRFETMYSIGKEHARQRSFVLAAYLLTEAWMSMPAAVEVTAALAERDPSTLTEEEKEAILEQVMAHRPRPVDDPEREEILLLQGHTLEQKTWRRMGAAPSLPVRWTASARRQGRSALGRRARLSG